MAKRMLDSGLINQRWYLELAPKYKALYIHLLCSCDCVGVFEINPVVMGLYIGDSITDDDIFTKFGNRVQRMPNNDSKGILVDFLYFQCGGELKEGCKPHESYIKHLKEVGLTVEQLQSMCTKKLYWTRIERQPEPPKYVRPLISTVQAPPPNELQTRPEDRGKEFDTYVASKFAEFWLAYPRHDSRAQAMAKFTRTIKNEKPDKRDELVKKMIAAVNKAKKSDQWSKDDGQFIPMATTWINQRRWEDEGVVVDAGGATQTASEEQKQRISSLFEPL